MKITFLGTGAADFLPSLADTDRFTVSRDIRRCTVTLLGEDIGMWAGTVFSCADTPCGKAAEWAGIQFFT